MKEFERKVNAFTRSWTKKSFSAVVMLVKQQDLTPGAFLEEIKSCCARVRGNNSWDSSSKDEKGPLGEEGDSERTA